MPRRERKPGVHPGRKGSRSISQEDEHLDILQLSDVGSGSVSQLAWTATLLHFDGGIRMQHIVVRNSCCTKYDPVPYPPPGCTLVRVRYEYGEIVRVRTNRYFGCATAATSTSTVPTGSETAIPYGTP